jgi:hypothetical protein
MTLLRCGRSEPAPRGETYSAAPSTAAASGPSLAEKRPFTPPYEPFTLTEWRPPVPKDAPVSRPTKDLLFPWYVIVDQRTPRPKKNFQWTELPAERGGELELPSGSAWKCIHNPVRFVAQTDRDDERLTGWTVVRNVRCTTDGWATYVEGAHGVTASLDGKRAPISPQMELHLRDRLGEKPAEVSVVMRSDDPRPKPTKGPGWKERLAPLAGPTSGATR